MLTSIIELSKRKIEVKFYPNQKMKDSQGGVELRIKDAQGHVVFRKTHTIKDDTNTITIDRKANDLKGNPGRYTIELYFKGENIIKSGYENFTL